MRQFLVVALVTASLISSVIAESSVILKSGETLKGDVISDTNDVLSIEVHNASRTISFQRDISHADIQSIQTESSTQLAERSAYGTLSSFQLNPNQEQSAAYCGQAIAAFQKFLTDYPKSENAPGVQQRLDAWQSELKHVSNSEVKFGDKWMTPEEKQPLAEHWQKQMNVQAAQSNLESLKKKVIDLQRQRDKLANNTAIAQSNLIASQQTLASLQDSQVLVYQNVTSPQYLGPGRVGGNAVTTSQILRDGRGNPVYNTVPSPERPGVQSDIANYQQEIATGQHMLAALDAKIQGIFQLQIPKAEQEYKTALAQLSTPPPPPASQSMASKADIPPPPPSH